MNTENPICPVCSLFLRPGITLQTHLKTHPKQKVIEALVRLSNNDQAQKGQESASDNLSTTSSTQSTSSQWPGGSIPVPMNGMTPPSFPSMNHSFIYQQFMSSSTQPPGVLNVNSLNPQYVTIPTILNPQMMCPPYVYQQQQVIMSTGAPLMPRPLPLEMPDTIKASNEENLNTNDKVIVIDDEKIEDEKIEDEVEKEEEIKIVEEKEENLEEKVEEGISEQDPNMLSPRSNASSDTIRVRTDLNKACQTQQNTSGGLIENSQDVQFMDLSEDEAHFYVSLSNASASNYSNCTQNEPIYTTPSTNGQPNEVNLIEMDGMNLVLTNDFTNTPVISQVEDFECIQNRNERTRILMTIGGMDNSRELFIDEPNEDNLSFNGNICTDEQMPSRGEISGQESNSGTGDLSNWNRLQYEGSSGMCNSYDLLARETWETSDASDSEQQPPENGESDVEVPPLEGSIDDDTPTISGYLDPPIMYKCPNCEESFKCPKERRVHQKEKHNKVELNEIGSKIGKKKVKKLIIKPKKIEIKSENNFDFANKLKVENSETDVQVDRTSVISSPITTELEPVEKSEEDKNSLTLLICNICNVLVPNNKALKKHKYEVHKLSSSVRHKCMTCEEVFSTEPEYSEHLKIHPLECRVCGKLFCRKQSLQLHIKRHLGIKPYKCNICEKSFLTKQKHDEHRNVHTGEAPIKCNMCDESFRRHSNLVQHRNRHHLNIKKKMKDFICHCGEIFHSKKKLAWHKEIHDPKPKSCTQCTEKFVHMSSLTRHMRRAHNENFVPNKERIVENVTCPICNGVYLKSSLEMHVKSHSGERPYTCLICNKDFTTKWNLKLHKWTHASRTSKPFKCELCKGAFIRESDYVAHMNSHKSIKPYTCNYCGAQFIRKYNCQRHVKEHEKSKNYSCQVCGKQFHRSYYLKDHMRVHSGVRPYSCHICGKTSTTKSNHNKHVRIHHAREPVSTEN